MRFSSSVTLALALILTFAGRQSAVAQTPATASKPGGMEVLIPETGITRVPDNNDYNDPDAEYSNKRKKETEHFILFWAKEYGDDPMANETQNRRFDADAIIKECERFYTFYVNDMKWVDKDKSYATKYKFLIYIIGGQGGTAFGGSVANKIGAFWSPATRVNKGPYGVVAHELGHSFQALLRADGFNTPGALGEMTSQWMLWQVYPEWMTFENYHLRDFMKATHLAFLHPDNQYHSAYPLEYWSNKHGIEIIGRIWREGERGDDAVMRYKKITNLTQDQFNDEMFDTCRRFVTWDMPRIEKVAAPYANQHITSIKKLDAGWYQIAADHCPENYGYNAIKLQVPEKANTKVSLDFAGFVGGEGFRNVRPDNAGWRYGFVASKEDGSRVYSDTFSKKEGVSVFTVPDKTKFLWLVVMGAPTEHWTHVSSRGGGGGGNRGRRGGRGGAARGSDAAAGAGAGAGERGAQAAGGERDAERGGRRGDDAVANAAPAQASAPNPNAGEQWPYKFKLTGTAPDDSTLAQ